MDNLERCVHPVMRLMAGSLRWWIIQNLPSISMASTLQLIVEVVIPMVSLKARQWIVPPAIPMMMRTKAHWGISAEHVTAQVVGVPPLLTTTRFHSN